MDHRPCWQVHYLTSLSPQIYLYIYVPHTLAGKVLLGAKESTWDAFWKVKRKRGKQNLVEPGKMNRPAVQHSSNFMQKCWTTRYPVLQPKGMPPNSQHIKLAKANLDILTFPPINNAQSKAPLAINHCARVDEAGACMQLCPKYPFSQCYHSFTSMGQHGSPHSHSSTWKIEKPHG